MGRPKGSKNKPKEVTNLARVTSVAETEIAFNEPNEHGAITGNALYKAIKDAGFPQGGVGNWLDVNNERLYIPHTSEVYNQFIADPDGWVLMTESMLRVWLEQKR